jgi:hypothetical protein
MSNIRDTIAELLLAERAIRSLGTLRLQLTFNERLRIGELLRDCADALDHGAGPVSLPAQPAPAPQLEQLPDPKPATGEVQVTVRPLGAKHRPPSRPARPRNIVTAD